MLSTHSGTPYVSDTPPGRARRPSPGGGRVNRLVRTAQRQRLEVTCLPPARPCGGLLPGPLHTQLLDASSVVMGESPADALAHGTRFAELKQCSELRAQAPLLLFHGDTEDAA